MIDLICIDFRDLRRRLCESIYSVGKCVGEIIPVASESLSVYVCAQFGNRGSIHPSTHIVNIERVNCWDLLGAFASDSL